MSGAVKNQHYVPQMYLKCFSENNKRINVWKIENDCNATSIDYDPRAEIV